MSPIFNGAVKMPVIADPPSPPAFCLDGDVGSPLSATPIRRASPELDDGPSSLMKAHILNTVWKQTPLHVDKNSFVNAKDISPPIEEGDWVRKRLAESYPDRVEVEACPGGVQGKETSGGQFRLIRRARDDHSRTPVQPEDVNTIMSGTQLGVNITMQPSVVDTAAGQRVAVPNHLRDTMFPSILEINLQDQPHLQFPAASLKPTMERCYIFMATGCLPGEEDSSTPGGGQMQISGGSHTDQEPRGFHFFCNRAFPTGRVLMGELARLRGTNFRAVLHCGSPLRVNLEVFREAGILDAVMVEMDTLCSMRYHRHAFGGERYLLPRTTAGIPQPQLLGVGTGAQDCSTPVRVRRSARGPHAGEWTSKPERNVAKRDPCSRFNWANNS